MKNILPLCLVLVLCGCVVTPNVSRVSENQVIEKCTVRHDDFLKGTSVEGMRIGFGFLGSDNYGLRAVKLDDSPTIHYSVWMSTDRSPDEGWAFWETAYDENGKRLNCTVKPIHNVHNGGFTYESITFDCTREWLEAARLKGIKVRIDGSRARQVLEFSTNYVAGFLKASDKVLK
jgi:hypothetical protein